MKLTINEIHAVAAWSWIDGEDEVCGICRVQFDGTCPTCIYPGEGCPLIVGQCHHRFHSHCIAQWLEVETSRGLCPMCRQPFEVEDSRASSANVLQESSVEA